MKALQELVAYFDRRGRLTAAEIHALLDRGFLATDAPPNMLDLCDPVGATYYFRVTGDPAGPLWGTDVYTGDSSLAAACVHMGLLKPGESGIVRVEACTPLAQYAGSARNGVTSHEFGRYGSAYRVAAV